jgi:hypothetical protein
MKRLDADEAEDVGALPLYDRFASTIFDSLSQQLASRQDAEDLLGRPEGTVRKMLARTLLKLRVLYEQTERENHP